MNTKLNRKPNSSQGKSNNIRWSCAAVSGVTLLLCGCMLATPTQAWFTANRASAASVISAAEYRITVLDQYENTVEKSVVLDLGADDLHSFFLQATGTASTGYCIIQVEDTAGNVTQSYCIDPIIPGAPVRVDIKATANTRLSFDHSWGKYSGNATKLEPVAGYARESIPSVYLEVSSTPSIEYVVPEGATLEAIAEYYGVSAEDILTFNGLEEIAPGDVIRIPYITDESAPEPYAPSKAQVYVVQEGDTLQAIADAHEVPLSALCQWNQIDVTAEIWPGMELEIPIMAPIDETEEIEETEVTEDSQETEETEVTEDSQETEETGSTVESQVTVEQETLASQAEETDTRPSCEVNDVPLYYQNDYADVMYGSGTVATSGCSITCLAMVGSAMTDYDYNPAELAEYFGGRAENNIERLEIGSDALHLAWEKSENWHVTWQALQDGKMAIALMESDSLFTDNQHFIVLTGLNENGLIMVNDPSSQNYTHWQLQRGFEEGFTPNDILLGYSGAWIYDREAMPEEGVERYVEERLDRSPANSRYGITLTAEERELLARMVWVEARGECAEGQQAVAEVVFNRLVSDRFPGTVASVIYAEGQFESVPLLDKAEPYQAQYQAIDRALYGEPVLPMDVFYFGTSKKTDDVWGMIGGHIFSK